MNLRKVVKPMFLHNRFKSFSFFKTRAIQFKIRLKLRSKIPSKIPSKQGNNVSDKKGFG